MIHKLSEPNNGIYCVDLTNINHPPTKSNKKIHHIVVIDNRNINDSSNLNTIKNAYPQMLCQYSKIAAFEYVSLITTFPKLKCMSISNDSVYTEFKRIPYNNNFSNSSLIDDKMLDMCIGDIVIAPDVVNEIVIFTRLSCKPTSQIINLLNKLNEHTLSIIIDNTIDLEPFITYKLLSVDEYDNFINSRIFCHVQDNNTLVTKLINTKTANIFGTNTNELSLYNTYNFIPITKEIDSIIIDGIEYDLIKHDLTTDNIDILNMIECVLYNASNINETITNFKHMLLLCENTDIETKNKAMALYYKYKCIYNEFINKTIGDITTNKENNDSEENVDTDTTLNENVAIILDYGKKTTLSHNKNFKIPKFNQININKFIEMHDDNIDDSFNNSKEFFESHITLSNWYDEIKSSSALGILFTFVSSELTKKGVHGFGNVSNVTCTFLSIIDFIDDANKYFEKNSVDYGNLNDADVITDGYIGTSNAILPIYIHKQHWLVAKTYLQPLLGLIQSHSPFIYTKAHDNIYYSVFMHMTAMLFTENKQYTHNKFVRIYFSFFRTCAEICFENKYNFGIKKLMESYMSNPINRISKAYLDYDKLFTQTLTTGYNVVDIKIFLIYLLEESIRLSVRKEKYTLKYLCTLQEIIGDSDKLNTEFTDLIMNICDSLQYVLEGFIAYYKINIIFREIINKSGTYSQFIKQFDKSYNMLSNDLTEFVINSITQTNVNNTFEDFYNIIGVPYDKNKIIMYILQGIKCSKNNIMVNYINDKKYIDVLHTDISDEFIINYLK